MCLHQNKYFYLDFTFVNYNYYVLRAIIKFIMIIEQKINVSSIFNFISLFLL